MRLVVLTFMFFCGLNIANAQNLITVSKDTLLMGVAFKITAVHKNYVEAKKSIVIGISEITRIEKQISSWKASSQTTLINTNAGIKPVIVSKDLFNLIYRAKKLSQISNGYFDISFASLDKIWRFDSTYTTLPSKNAIKQSVSKINYNNIVLDTATLTVFLKDKGMKIGFGAIGKGYAADKAKQLMQANGANSGVINAGGDLISWGQKLNGKPWTIGIANPNNKTNVLSWLNISNMAVATSGNYEKYITINGKRYCHIVNPKTGWPVAGIKSVTTICETAELADGLATTVFVLGVKNGLQLINKLTGVECMIIDEGNKIHYSKNIKLNFVKND